MTEQEARLILQACRPGEVDRSDPQIAEARRLAEQNPALAHWFEEEQTFDRAIAARLAAVPVPFGLETRILAQGRARTTSPWSRWLIGLAGAAALLFLLAQIAEVWRHAGPEPARVADYAGEMTSFIKVTPSLEMMSDNLGEIKGWLTNKGIVPSHIPPELAALQPVGCRVLSFRGHNVTLICFQRGNDRLAHLFVVDRAALPELKARAPAVFNHAGDWTSATWAEGDHVYLLATQGDEETLQHLLPRA